MRRYRSDQRDLEGNGLTSEEESQRKDRLAATDEPRAAPVSAGIAVRERQKKTIPHNQPACFFRPPVGAAHVFRLDFRTSRKPRPTHSGAGLFPSARTRRRVLFPPTHNTTAPGCTTSQQTLVVGGFSTPHS